MLDVVSRLNKYMTVAEGSIMRLLRKDDVALQLTLLAFILESCGEKVSATAMYSTIASMFADIERAGYGHLLRQREGKNIQPKVLCKQIWCDELGLLERIEEDGNEMYRITAVAQEAVRLISNLGAAPAQLASSRINDMQARIIRLAARSNDKDMDALRELYEKEMREAQERYDRFTREGHAPLSNAEMKEQVGLLNAEIDQAVSDLYYVGDYLRDAGKKLIDEFRHDDSPRMQIIDGYLERHDAIVRSEIEGRSYMGVVNLLQQSDLRSSVLDAFEKLNMNLPGDTDVATLEAKWDRLLIANTSVSNELQNSVKRIEIELERLDSDGVRSYAKNIRAFRNIVEDAAQKHRLDHESPLKLSFVKGEFNSVSTQVLPKARPVEMPPLERADSGEPVPIETYMGYCAPRTRNLVEAITEAAGEREEIVVSEVFNALPVEYRRDVEVGALGVLALLAGKSERPVRTVEYHCIGADGSERIWLSPEIVVTPEILRECLEKEDL